MKNLHRYEGRLLGKHHISEQLLGKGTFGLVIKCRNGETDKMEAIKINKSTPEILHQARQELNILKQLQCLDPDTCNIVKWNGFFFHKKNICLNFELLDTDLRNYMKERHPRGLPMSAMRSIIHQLAIALFHLRSVGIVHADLKPANIMIVDRYQQPLKVKVIDFGLAEPSLALKPGACVQTIWYRAPEVILHINFNEVIDMWSLGVIAAELATGHPLYPGETEYDVLRYIIDIQGQPADDVLDRGMGTRYYFNKSTGHQRWRFKTPVQMAKERRLIATEKRTIRLSRLDSLQFFMFCGCKSEQSLYVDLIKKMLHLDSDQRIKPLEVLQHPFFAHSIHERSPVQSCVSTDTDVETPEDSLQSSWKHIAGPEDIKVQGPNASLDAGFEETTKHVPLLTSTENGGFFNRLFGWISDSYHYFFPRVDNQIIIPAIFFFVFFSGGSS